MNSNFLVQAINLALSLLSNRVFAFLSLLLTAGLFSWCMYDPSYERIVSATIFGILCLIYDKREAEKPKGETE